MGVELGAGPWSPSSADFAPETPCLPLSLVNRPTLNPKTPRPAKVTPVPLLFPAPWRPREAGSTVLSSEQ